jgi:hypothetical protein
VDFLSIKNFTLLLLDDYLKKLGRTYEFYGLSKDKIKKKLDDSNIERAKSLFQKAKDKCGEGDVELYIQFATAYIKKAGRKMAAIGASDNIIQKLLVKGYIAEAKIYAKKAKESIGENEKVEEYIGYARLYLDKSQGKHPEQKEEKFKINPFYKNDGSKPL